VATVTLILKDLYPYRTSPEAAGLPRLTAFERWMARARGEPLPLGWRRALAADFVPQATSEGGAAAGAAGVRADPRCSYWLATPVHFLAGLDTLRLHPAGLLSTTLEEQCALSADFEQVFQGSGWMLRVTERRELLLDGPPAAGISCLDPARFLGRAVREGVPQGVGAPALRRLMSEIEMWLHEHPLNELRIAVGKLPISGLWLWGGGNAIEPAPHALPPLFGTDLAIESLWRLAGAPRQPLPAQFSALADVRVGGAVVIAEVPSGTGPEVLQQIERDWIAPLLAHALNGGSAATLLCADKRFTLNRRARWRFWRRARPWWEPMSGS
jgi:hypothetical protein